MSADNGGPAFPQKFMDDGQGMTLRDWFAGQALAGLCANPGGPFQANDYNGWSITNCSVDDIATQCSELADAMLAARRRP